MRLYPPSALVAAILLTATMSIACGLSDPDLRAADWEEHFDRARQATASGRHDEAIAIAGRFLESHPDNVDAHLMVGDALTEAGRAASDATRPARFKQAVPHYTRALELTRNPLWRLLALTALVSLYDPHGLDNPDEAARYARMLITDNPGDANAYGSLLVILKERKQYDEAVSLLAEARGAIQPDAEAVATYSGMVHDLVVFSPEFPRETGRTLLADTVTLTDQSLGKYGRTEKLLRSKGMLLRAQAELEPDRGRQQALLEESSRTFDELDRLAK